MKLSNIKDYNSKFYKSSIRSLIPHLVFFWLRLSISAFLSKSKSKLNTKNYSLKYLINNNSLVWPKYSLYQLYLIVESLANTNMLEYRLASIIAIHNALISFSTIFFCELEITFSFLISIILITFLYMLDVIYVIYNVYSKRNEYGFQLFKKIGPDQKINDAYAIRQCLKIFRTANFFISFSLSYRFLAGVNNHVKEMNLVAIIFSMVSICQQLACYVKPDAEDYKQRKYAIILSIVKVIILFVTVYIHLLCIINSDIKVTLELDLVFLTDTILMSLGELYYLIKDMKIFGSGLKKHLEFRTYGLNLKNRY